VLELHILCSSLLNLDGLPILSWCGWYRYWHTHHVCFNHHAWWLGVWDWTSA